MSTLTAGGGPLGDGGLSAGRHNMAIARRAVRDDWPIPPELRELLVAQMGAIVRRSRKDRNKIAAARVLIAADRVNASREAMDLAAESKSRPSVHIHAHANLDPNSDPAGLLAFAQELGVEDLVIEGECQPADGNPGSDEIEKGPTAGD